MSIRTFDGEDVSALWVSQPRHLTYKEVDGQFFVTNHDTQEIVVLNRRGFDILRLCQDRTIAGICVCLSRDAAQSIPPIKSEEVIEFLSSLLNIGLIRVDKRVRDSSRRRNQRSRSNRHESKVANRKSE